MLIEARLRQLRCLPTRGGVRVLEFVTTWHISINQMEAAGFLPGTRQLLAIFADGLPNNTVAFINLYDSIISSLNEPNEQLLPNIHSLFDRTIHIENNIQRHRILYPNPRRPQSSNPPPSSSAQPTSPPAAAIITPQSTRPPRTGTTQTCTNCGRDGHTAPTCFQPGGAMEGRREEYLASRVPKQLHISQKLKRTSQILKRVHLLLKRIHLIMNSPPCR